MSLPKILVVDDEEINRTLIHELLVGGYDLKESNSAEACLLTIESWLPDIFILDVNMPGMDGFELCSKLKDSPLTEDIPVIFVSASSEVGDRLKGYEAGGDEYMGRPFTSWELLKKIELMLTNKAALDSYRIKSKTASDVAMAAMINAGEIGHVLTFFRDSFATKSFESLADQLIEVVSFYGVNAIVEIKTDFEVIQRTFRGNLLSAVEQKVMDSLRGVKNIHSFGTRTAFNYHTVSLIVMNMPPDDPDKAGRLRDHIAMLVEGGNARAEMMVLEQKAEQQRAIVNDAVNIASSSLGSIEEQQVNNQEELTMIMSCLVSDVSKSFFTMGMTEEQEEEVMELINMAEIKTNALFEKNEGLSKDLKAVTLMLGVSKELL